MLEKWKYNGITYKIDVEIDYPKKKKFLFYFACFSPFILGFVLVLSIVEKMPISIHLLYISLIPICASFPWMQNKRAWDSARQQHLAEEKRKREFEKEHPYYKQEQFYQLCIKENIRNTTQRENIERIKLLAKREGISGNEKELIEMYQIGEKEVVGKEKSARIAELQKEEQETEESNNKYIKLHGRDKLIKYCQDRIAEYRQIILQCERDENTINNGGEVLYNSSKQKETDWAIMGGIANGLGGIGAGVSTALDIQVKNAQVRANNQNLAHNIAQMQVFSLQQVWDRKRSAESSMKFWQEELEKAEIMLVEELPQDTLLKELKPAVKEIKVSESGAVRLKIEFSHPENLKIFDNVPAYIDGSFKAVLKVNNKIAGVAYATLPYDGSNGYSSINAVCRNVSISAKDYDVSFKPNNLWAMGK